MEFDYWLLYLFWLLYLVSLYLYSTRELVCGQFPQGRKFDPLCFEYYFGIMSLMWG